MSTVTLCRSCTAYAESGQPCWCNCGRSVTGVAGMFTALEGRVERLCKLEKEDMPRLHSQFGHPPDKMILELLILNGYKKSRAEELALGL